KTQCREKTSYGTQTFDRPCGCSSDFYRLAQPRQRPRSRRLPWRRWLPWWRLSWPLRLPSWFWLPGRSRLGLVGLGLAGRLVGLGSWLGLGRRLGLGSGMGLGMALGATLLPAPLALRTIAIDCSAREWPCRK